MKLMWMNYSFTKKLVLISFVLAALLSILLIITLNVDADEGEGSIPTESVVTAVYMGIREATVHFDPPVSDGGHEITEYTVRATPDRDSIVIPPFIPENLREQFIQDRINILTKSATGTSSPIVVSGLSNGMKYSFTVLATNIKGSSPTVTSEVYTTPSVPTMPTISEPTNVNNDIVIEFTPSTVVDEQYPVTSYKLTYYYLGEKTITNITESPIIIPKSDLEHGTNYDFYLVAINAVGESLTSSHSLYYEIKGVTPEIVSVTQASHVDIWTYQTVVGHMIEFNLPGDPNFEEHDTITYTITDNSGNTIYGTRNKWYEGQIFDGNKIFVDNLEPFTNYTLTLQSDMNGLYSEVSEPFSFTTNDPPRIDSRNNPFSVIYAKEAIIFKFNYEPVGNEPMPTKFYYDLYEEGGTEVIASFEADITYITEQKEIVFDNLVKGRKYVVEVVAENSVGRSLPFRSYQMPAFGPPDPITLEDVSVVAGYENGFGTLQMTIQLPIGEKTGGRGYGGFRLLIESPGNAGTGSMSTGMNNNRENYISTFNEETGVLQIKLLKLSPNKDYKLSFTHETHAMNNVRGMEFGDFEARIELPKYTTEGPPLEPTNVVAVAGEETATISFVPPTNTGGKPIIGYEVTAYDESNQAVRTSTFDVDDIENNTVAFSGLSGNVSYTFTVKAKNEHGTGVESTKSAPVVPYGTPQPPSITQVNSGTNMVTVSFSAPENNGGREITAYHIYVYNNAAEELDKQSFILEQDQLTHTDFNFDVTNLDSGVPLTFKVTAENISGESGYSEAHSGMAYGKPDAPVNAVVSYNDNGWLDIEVTVPVNTGGQHIQEYRVELILDGQIYTDYQLSRNQSNIVSLILADSEIILDEIRIYSYNGLSYSDEAFVIEDVPVFGEPKGELIVTSAVAGNGSVTLNFQYDQDIIVTPIREYSFIIQATDDPSISYPVTILADDITFDESHNASYVVNNVAPNHTYQVSDGAVVNVIGLDKLLSTGASTVDKVYGQPSVQQVVAHYHGINQVELEIIANNNGREITQFEVTPYLNGTTAGTAVILDVADSDDITYIDGAGNYKTRAITLPDNAGNDYTFTVKAINAAGDALSEHSNSVFVYGNIESPVLKSTDGKGALKVVFTPGSTGGFAIPEYEVQLFRNGNPFAAPMKVNVGNQGLVSLLPADNQTDLQLVVNNLAKGFIFGVKITPRGYIDTDFKETGTALFVEDIEIFAAPAVPGVSVIEVGDEEALLSVQLSSDDGGLPVESVTFIAQDSAGLEDAIEKTVLIDDIVDDQYTMTGLTKNTAYKFSLVATNEVGDSPQSEWTQDTLIEGKADAPTNVTAVAGESTATVTWDAPENDGGSAVTSYEVTAYVDDTAVVTPETLSVSQDTDLTVTFENLTKNTTYTFKVVAINAHGESEQSVASAPITVYGKPEAPTIVYATGGLNSVTLTVTPPTDTGGLSLTKYIVKTTLVDDETLAAREFNLADLEGTSHTLVVNELEGGSYYSFEISVMNELGYESNVVSTSNDVLAFSLPTAPVIVEATGGIEKAKVEFQEPANDGGKSITAYEFTLYEENSEGEFIALAPVTKLVAELDDIDEGVYEYEATSLTKNTHYKFTIKAITEMGSSPASQESNEVLVVGVPDMPTNVTAVSLDADNLGKASISFNAPQNNGGEAITSYEVAILDDEDTLVETIELEISEANDNLSDTSFTVQTKSLNKGESYYAKLRAINVIGPSEYTTPVLFIVEGLPDAASIISVDAQVRSVTLTVADPDNTGGTPITEYIAYVEGVEVGRSATNEIEIDGLENGATYLFVVKVANKHGLSPSYSTEYEVTIADVPSAPTQVVATAGHETATISFTAPAATSGYDVTAYDVNIYSGDSLIDTVNISVDDITNNVITVPNLDKNTLYSFTLVAHTEVGESEASSPSAAVLVFGLPDVPLDVTAEAGVESATVSFSAPANNGGKVITDYKAIAYLDGQSVAELTSAENDLDFLRFNFTNLTKNTAYTFAIIAINEEGESSAAMTASTLVYGVPDAPTNVKALTGNASATISFAAPVNTGGKPVTSYKVVTNSGEEQVFTSTSGRFTGLINGTEYSFTVIAINEAGESIASTASNVIKPVLQSAPLVEAPVTDLPAVITKNGILNLTANQAGETSFEEEIIVTIPAGAATQDLALTITQVNELTGINMDNMLLTSTVFELLKNFSQNFSTDITLRIKYDTSLQTETNKPSIFYYDEELKQWIELGGTVSGEFVSVNVDHFTKFAVFMVDSSTVTPQPEAPVASAPVDIAGHWSEQYVLAAISKGIVNGYPDGTFKPNSTITRAEFAVMLSRALELKESAETTFTDEANIQAWAKEAVAKVVYANIVGGYPDGQFKPSNQISRAELAVMVNRALGKTSDAAAQEKFTDESLIPSWAKDAIYNMKSFGIIGGRVNGEFAAQDVATRAEAVKVLTLLLEQLAIN